MGKKLLLFLKRKLKFLFHIEMLSYTISAKAYLKIFFHAAKHPHKPVNGVLLGKKEENVITIDDAIPLLHHWTSLSPMMEIGLDLVSYDTTTIVSDLQV